MITISFFNVRFFVILTRAPLNVSRNRIFCFSFEPLELISGRTVEQITMATFLAK